MGGGYHGDFGATMGASTVGAIPMEVSLVGNGRGYSLAENMKKVAPIPGFEDVAIHGYPDGFQFSRINPQTGENEDIALNQRQLATFLKHSPGYKGGNIRLVSCSTGSKPDSIAQHLANKLGVTVIAPTDTAWVWSNGKITIGPNQYKNTGTWRYYYPQGKKGGR